MTALRFNYAGGVGTTTTDFSSPPIKPGQIGRVRYVALNTTDPTNTITVQLGITRQGTFIQLVVKTNVAKADALGVLVDWILLEGDQITARLTGAGANDQFTFYASGELHEDGDGAVVVALDPPPGWQPPKP